MSRSFRLKIAQTLPDAALQLARSVGVAAIEIKRQRLRVAIGQAFAPTSRNYQCRPHAIGRANPIRRQIGRIAYATETFCFLR